MSQISSLGVQPRKAQPTTKNMGDMKPEDFLKLLITQLQHQDPFEPVTNQDLLAQITSIRDLQSSIDLNATLTAMTRQQQIVSAGALIGKVVEGFNANMERVSGSVTSVSVQGEGALLELDTGQRIAIKDLLKVWQ